mgnify:CR=1 FL=1
MATFPKIPEWVQLEHHVARILTDQELHGWYFNEQAAWELESALRRELEDVTQLLRNRFPFTPGTVFTPKRSNRTRGYVEGAPFTKLKDTNPASRDHIAWILQTFDNWSPSVYTATGKPVVDEVELAAHGTDIAMSFLKILDTTKKLGMLSEGNNAWNKLVTKNRIHHHCSVATNTHRCAHRSPNLSQVPSDSRFRELFTATPGLAMVGADLAGIELRMLGHYLARYDGGRYVDILLNGDIHQENADKIGISRKLVKNVTYAFLYGAGDIKIGHTYDKQLSEDKARKKGKEIRAAYIEAVDGLDRLLSAIKEKAASGKIRSIDGRNILLDSQHKALNYCLQSGAGTIAKRWMVMANDYIKEHPYYEARQLGFIHDELQFEAPLKYTNDVQFILELNAARAGEFYELRCPVAAESKVGRTWADVH